MNERDEMKEKDVSRRDFLRVLTILCASGPATTWVLGSRAGAVAIADAGSEQTEEETMKAFADTIIPGPASDPEGSVGGVEAGVLEVFYDPYYGLRPFIPLLASGLNLTSLSQYRKPFKDLNLSQRTEIMLGKDDRSPIKPIYEHAELLVALAFYGGIINMVGYDYISFPGPAFGYYDYSFNENFANEGTEDGNLP